MIFNSKNKHILIFTLLINSFFLTAMPKNEEETSEIKIDEYQTKKFEIFQQIIDEQKSITDKMKMIQLLKEIRNYCDANNIKNKDLTFVTSENNPFIYQSVEEIAKKLEIPAPLIFKIKVPYANACATNIDKDLKFSVMLITEELENLLNKDELKAVIAHELGHIKHHHTEKFDKIMNTVTITTGIASLAIYLYLSSKAGLEIEDMPKTLAALSIAGSTLTLFNLQKMIIESYLSRKNETQADLTAAKNTNPQNMISSLTKIENNFQKSIDTYFNDRDFFIDKYENLKKEINNEKINFFKKLYLKFKLHNAIESEIKDQIDLENKIVLIKILGSHPTTENRIKTIEKNYPKSNVTTA